MSGTNYVQNGRQPPLPNQPQTQFAPTSNSRAVNEQKAICRKYVWGTCVKSTNCKFRHELDLEEMKKILKFCHDFQNKQGCARDSCTYLHTSREEQDLFLSTGQLPRVLAERYAVISETSNSMHFEGVPQHNMFVTPPPPPPPPAPMMAAVGAPPPPPPPQQHMLAFPPIQQPPPPPPPPTLPPTTLVQTPPVFSGPPPQSATSIGFPVNQPPPPLPPMFDASRPPPPIPAQARNTIKRRIDIEAGPSKVRKLDEPRDDEVLCENCVQRELRVSVYKQQFDKVSCELKCQKLIYQKKSREHEHGKEILRMLVNPELYRMLEEYVEGGPPQLQDILAQYSQNPIVSFMEYILTNSRHAVDSALSPSLRIDDPLPSLSRITNPINHSSSALLQSFFQVFRNSNNDGESTNGQRDEGSVPITSAGQSTTARTPVQGSNVVPASAPTPIYPTYHPSVPPPTNRTYYQQPYTNMASTSTSMPNNVTYNTPARVGVTVPLQMSARPSTSAPAPSMPTSYSEYMMGRYPQPHQYYPPYQ